MLNLSQGQITYGVVGLISVSGLLYSGYWYYNKKNTVDSVGVNNNTDTNTVTNVDTDLVDTNEPK